MGQRGPKPGQYRMRPTPAGSPLIAKATAARHTTGAPPVPKHLGKAARAVWKRVTAEMERAGTVTHADRDILATYCVAVADLEQLSARIDAEGLMVQVVALDRNGRASGTTVTKMHPGIKWRSDLMNKVRQLAGELGLTPAARSRVSAAADAPGKPANRVIALREQIAAIRRGDNPPSTGNRVLDIAARHQAAQ